MTPEEGQAVAEIIIDCATIFGWDLSGPVYPRASADGKPAFAGTATKGYVALSACARTRLGVYTALAGRIADIEEDPAAAPDVAADHLIRLPEGLNRPRGGLRR